jgi:hypothetical protein
LVNSRVLVAWWVGPFRCGEHMEVAGERDRRGTGVHLTSAVSTRSCGSCLARSPRTLPRQRTPFPLTDSTCHCSYGTTVRVATFDVVWCVSGRMRTAS